MTSISFYAEKTVIGIIRVYQAIISSDHGVFRKQYGAMRCKFHPSCSEYAVGAIRQYGLTRGIMASVGRITRCNPWSAGGYDPVVRGR